MLQQHQEDVNKQKITSPSSSSWISPLLVVPKKINASGKKKWRICVGFRKLNDVTIGDSYPLPNIQDILDQLGIARFSAALDCAGRYWQIRVAEGDKCKTAFSTRGHFEFERNALRIEISWCNFPTHDELYFIRFNRN